MLDAFMHHKSQTQLYVLAEIP